MKKKKLTLSHLRVTSFITRQKPQGRLKGGKRFTEWCTRNPDDGACSIQDCITPPTESCRCYPETEVICTDTIEDITVTASDWLVQCGAGC